MKVAIYCRLSEEDRNKVNKEDDSNSIQNQKSMLLQYCLERGWDPYGIYSDDDYTGADRNRPEFNRLIEDAKNKRFDIVLCKSQSRFTREVEIVEKYIHGLFPIWGIRFISLVDNADTDIEGNKKSRQINALVNEWYLEDMSKNIKSVLTNRRKNGFHIGAFCSYGYKKDSEQKGHLIVDEEAAAVVREIFELYVSGMSKMNIARHLNDRGIPNPTAYKIQKGIKKVHPAGKTSDLWKYFSINDILTNEMYIGNMVQGKYGSESYKTKKNKPRPKDKWYVVENTHEPIIDKDLWDRAQELIKLRAKPFDTGNIGIFAKKVRCLSCGYVMRSWKSGGKHFLQCQTRFVSKASCEGAYIAIHRLEQFVINEINRLAKEFVDVDKVEESINFDQDIRSQINKIQLENKAYSSKINEYTNALKEIYLDKIKGIITEDEFLSFSHNFGLDKERLEKKIKENDKKIISLNTKISSANSKRELIQKYTNLEHLTREIVDTLIDYIEIGPRFPKTRDRPIIIHWNF